MKIQIVPTMKWEDAPDTIGPLDLAKILGIGEIAARSKFDEPGFPRISGLGSTRKADKEAVRLYIQGIKVKEKPKELLLYMILEELKKINKVELQEKVG